MSDGTYGAPRIREELADVDGIKIGTKRVYRLMKRIGLEGVSGRRFITTTTRDDKALPAPDLVDRRFEADGPNQLWVADITYVPTWAGFLFLSVVIDVWSRKVVGWAMAADMKTELIIKALDMAVAQRQPRTVVHHSDQGTQGGFNWSSQHLDAGGVHWRVATSRFSRCRRVRGGNGQRIERYELRCVHQGGRSHLARCNGSSGAVSRRESRL